MVKSSFGFISLSRRSGHHEIHNETLLYNFHLAFQGSFDATTGLNFTFPFSFFCECICVCFWVRFCLYRFAFTISPRVRSVRVFFFYLKNFFFPNKYILNNFFLIFYFQKLKKNLISFFIFFILKKLKILFLNKFFVNNFFSYFLL